MKKLSLEAIKGLLLPMEEEMSEGEEFIRDFFEEHDFKFVQEQEIKGLRGDTKSYCRADFYLPKYGLYVEFLGNWNTSVEYRNGYKEKMRTYYRNGIPCVYLFPENLGTLEHSFRRRSKEVLFKFGMRKELLYFNMKWYWKEARWFLLGLLVPVYMGVNSTHFVDWLITAFFGGMLVFSLYSSWHLHSRVVRSRKPTHVVDSSVPLQAVPR